MLKKGSAVEEVVTDCRTRIKAATVLVLSSSWQALAEMASSDDFIRKTRASDMPLGGLQAGGTGQERGSRKRSDRRCVTLPGSTCVLLLLAAPGPLVPTLAKASLLHRCPERGLLTSRALPTVNGYRRPHIADRDDRGASSTGPLWWRVGPPAAGVHTLRQGRRKASVSRWMRTGESWAPPCGGSGEDGR